jgi:hypothetical protein
MKNRYTNNPINIQIASALGWTEFESSGDHGWIVGIDPMDGISVVRHCKKYVPDYISYLRETPYKAIWNPGTPVLA